MEKAFAPLLVLSFAVAAAGWVLPIDTALGLHPGLSLLGRAVSPAWMWIALFVFALVAFRWRGLWFLTSAPIAFVPTILIYLYISSCMPTKSCL